MGPIWDFNLALGNADYCSGSSTIGWAYKFNDVCPGDFFLAPFHYKRLLQDSLFSTQLASRWQVLRSDAWSDDRLFSMFDSLATVIETPAITNFEKWPILGNYIWPNNYVETDYNDGVAYTRSWLESRLQWLDSEIPKLVPEVDQAFYFGPRSTQDVLVLEGYRRAEYPVQVELFSSSGQLIYRQTVIDNSEPVNFSRRGLVFYRLENDQGEFKTGKLFVN